MKDPRFLPSHCSAILSDPGHHVNGQGWLSTSKKGQKSTEEQTQMSETPHLDVAHLTPLHTLTARTESHACILASRGTGSSDQLQLRNIGRGQSRFWLLPPVSVTMTDSQEFSPSLAGGHRFTWGPLAAWPGLTLYQGAWCDGLEHIPLFPASFLDSLGTWVRPEDDSSPCTAAPPDTFSSATHWGTRQSGLQTASEDPQPSWQDLRPKRNKDSDSFWKILTSYLNLQFLSLKRPWKINTDSQPCFWVISSWKIRYFWGLCQCFIFTASFLLFLYLSQCQPTRHHCYPAFAWKIPVVWTISYNHSLERASWLLPKSNSLSGKTQVCGLSLAWISLVPV